MTLYAVSQAFQLRVKTDDLDPVILEYVCVCVPGQNLWAVVDDYRLLPVTDKETLDKLNQFIHL